MQNLPQKGDGSLMDLVPLDDNGMLRPKTLHEQLHCAEMLLKSGLFPSFNTEKAGPPALLQVIQSCIQLDLPIAMATSFFYYVKGKVSMYGDGPLMVVQRRPNTIDWIDEFYIDSDCQRISLANKNINKPIYGAVCMIKKHGDEKIAETFFTDDDAKRAFLYTKDIWKFYAKFMMKYKARTEALKGKFPEYLQGMEFAEYSHDSLPTEGIIADQVEGPLQNVGSIEKLEDRFSDSNPDAQQIQSQVVEVANEGPGPWVSSETVAAEVKDDTVTLTTKEPDLPLTHATETKIVDKAVEAEFRPTPQTKQIMEDAEKIKAAKKEKAAKAKVKAAEKKAAKNAEEKGKPATGEISKPTLVAPIQEPVASEIPTQEPQTQMPGPIQEVVNAANVVSYGLYAGKSLDTVPKEELVIYFNKLVDEFKNPEGDMLGLMTQIHKYLTP